MKKLFLGLFLFMSLIAICSVFFVSTVLAKFQFSISEFYTVVNQINAHQLTLENGRWNLLILGTDSVEGKPQDFPLTDTVLFVSIFPSKARIDLLPLPRDLWIPEYRTKINALYSYAIEQKKQEDVYIRPTIEKITGSKIHHMIVVDLKTVQEVIDTLGGVYVDIPRSFQDDLYPRANVDVQTEKDPSKLYETVVFVRGTELMSGERAIKYIRSRRSSDQIEGTDDARSNRQQLVLLGLKRRVLDLLQQFQLDPFVNLFSLYRSRYEQVIGIDELGAVLLSLYRSEAVSRLEVRSHSISDKIWNPPIRKYQQWVYEAKDPSFIEIQKAIQAGLNVEE